MAFRYDVISLLRPAAEEAGLIARAVSKGLISLESAGASGRILARVRAGAGEHFDLRARDLLTPDTILIYIWHADTEPEIFALTAAEALDILGEEPQKTASWCRLGRYNWSSATGLPRGRQERMKRLYGNNLRRVKALISG